MNPLRVTLDYGHKGLDVECLEDDWSGLWRSSR